MKVALVQFSPWDKAYSFSLNGLDIKRGYRVIVKTDLGMELGEVVGFEDVEDDGAGDVPAEAPGENGQLQSEDAGGGSRYKPVLRLATEHDLEKLPTLDEKNKALDYCIGAKDKLQLPMKFIDAQFAFDGSRITFAFIADGRVDFRELVKDLTRHFGRTIRLQQIGIRDEAKIMGDFGHCGRGLCCRGHLKDLESITSEMAELQQCAHRGSERISGICGRLMCCLAYEQGGYEELVKKLPPMDAKVSVDGKRGQVVGHHTLKQSVDVKFRGDKKDDYTVAEVDLNRHKKK